MERRAAEFYADMRRRRSVREFSDRPIPPEIIRNCLKAAGTAPNGANRQPWHFVVVTDPVLKHEIRTEAERVEREFYSGKAPQEWLDALAPLGTHADKSYLDCAPYLIVIFAQSHSLSPDGRKLLHYYVKESVGLATGILITAIHEAGLVCLTYTPRLMGFLNDLCERPSHERPFVILVVGYPAEGASVPQITKKPLEMITTFK
jgi:iodotyrosine deiodinase